MTKCQFAKYEECHNEATHKIIIKADTLDTFERLSCPEHVSSYKRVYREENSDAELSVEEL
jgi:hypothetical protein